MKKIILVIFFVLFSAPGFAERETISATILQSQAFKGNVKEIILPDPVNSIKHELVVINDQGKEMKFILTPGLGVYGPNWEVLNLKKINPKDKVLVEYTTTKKGDINKAISIMVMGNLEK
jgi:hypothetical protein